MKKLTCFLICLTIACLPIATAQSQPSLAVQNSTAISSHTLASSSTTIQGGIIQTATIVSSTTIAPVTPTIPAANNTVVSVFTVTRTASGNKESRFLWPNRRRTNCSVIGSTYTLQAAPNSTPISVTSTSGTASRIVISNTTDSVIRMRLRGNDSLVLAAKGEKNQAIKLRNLGRQSVLLMLHPGGELTFSDANDSIRNSGNSKAWFKVRPQAKLSITKMPVKKVPVKSSDKINFFIATKEDTLLNAREAPGAKINVTSSGGQQVRWDSSGFYINKIEGLTINISPKKKKPATPHLDMIARIYTDARGFAPNEPNGLLQTEFAINTHITNKLLLRFGNTNVYFLRNIMLPNFTLFRTKSDSSFRFAPVHYVSTGTFVANTKVNVHTINLVRYASWSVAGKLNLVTIQSKDKSKALYLDWYGIFYTTGVSYDSTLQAHFQVKPEDSRFMVNSFGHGFSFKGWLGGPNSNFCVEPSLAFYGLTLHSSDIRQSYGRFHQPDYNKRNDDESNVNVDPQKLQYFNGITTWGLQVRYSSKTNKENVLGAGLFLRVFYHTNPFGPRFKLNYGDNSFLQVQTGISISVKDLLTAAGLSEPK